MIPDSQKKLALAQYKPLLTRGLRQESLCTYVSVHSRQNQCAHIYIGSQKQEIQRERERERKSEVYTQTHRHCFRHFRFLLV